MVWSETGDVKNALASFHPRKPVPAHKYTTNKGRVELIKQANLGVHKKRYLEGWCQFVKAAKQNDAVLVLKSTAVVLHLHESGDQVAHVRAGALTALVGVDAVSAVPKGFDPLAGVQKLPRAQFLNQVSGAAASNGATLTL